MVSHCYQQSILMDYLLLHVKKEVTFLPRMSPYLLPSSALIIDNAQIHHDGRIDELCEKHGIILIYLPPLLT
ncbi:hypothetical protein CROQUDRAFT_694151 [Cronartium quercuum f. sp. fusiforme G11]|uniref:Tc1-like transposase DDE domain-containing protein n=1 Tax=Cronartium quercuum f. sp. fusiforme G11 TaxID=708437 RepID=A0A9P6NX63_9BASI|nr:hypothetical protein CROQUDRAFT_694151 [Cronartium quercuum f. sp. fusiforme G11]